MIGSCQRIKKKKQQKTNKQTKKTQRNMRVTLIPVAVDAL